jgi:hypothetical protein
VVTVADQLDQLLAEPPAPVDPEDLHEVHQELVAAAERAVELVHGHDAAARLPLRLPKGRVAALSACERFAVARHTAPHDDAVSVPALRGVALDRYVAHELAAGPVAHPLEDLLSMLSADADQGTRDQVIAAADQLELGPLATAAHDWVGMPTSWWPRTQTVAAVHLADAAVRLEGRLDVELGGPLTDRPGVVVEVKTGRPHRGHLDEVTYYALLVALRDGVAPALVARWYPGGSLAHLPVTGDVLRSATRRVVAALATWTELQCGRPPTESPGPTCAWCPQSDVCPSAAPVQDPLAELDADWEPESDLDDGPVTVDG